eukprot:sb/3475340/
MYRTLLLVVLSVSLCNAQNDYEEVHDTCNTLSSYMKARSQNYSQMYSAVPGEELAVCPGGQSCCSVTTEDYFKTEITTFMGKLHFDRTRNIAKLNAAKKNIIESISRSYPLNCSSFCHICLEPRHDL